MTRYRGIGPFPAVSHSRADLVSFCSAPASQASPSEVAALCGDWQNSPDAAPSFKAGLRAANGHFAG